MNGAVSMALFAIFFPWTRCRQGKKVFFPSFTTPLSPPPPICLKTPHNAHLIMAYHHDERGRGDKPWGQLPRGHPTTLLVWRDWTGEGWLSPPFPLINTSSPGDEKANKKKWKNKRKTKDEKARKKKGKKIGDEKRRETKMKKRMSADEQEKRQNT